MIQPPELSHRCLSQSVLSDTYFTEYTLNPNQTANGQCLFVDELSGDFRANLTPIQIADCDGSDGQQWDVITAGKHDNVPGAMLVVSTLVSSKQRSVIKML